MVVSASRLSFSMPVFALCARLTPSDVKGAVTIATTRAPLSFAAFAITCALPVPVPPPIPQVTNTKSVFVTVAFISSALSWADASPISGLLPAPIPRVLFLPRTSFLFAFVLSKCWASVFIAIIFVPIMPIS